jgi:hypothetical protein
LTEAKEQLEALSQQKIVLENKDNEADKIVKYQNRIAIEQSK